MSIIIDANMLEKADSLRKPLNKQKVYPTGVVEFTKCEKNFQNIKVVKKGKLTLPLVINAGEKLILDFGDHYVGYLNISLNNHGGMRICDSPLKIKLSFGEFPYEIVKPIEEYNGTLGDGWFQREEKSIPFMPYSSCIERRYAFRYLLIERCDTATYPVELNDIFVEAVSAVRLEDSVPVNIEDKRLKQIYVAALKTLKECEQDVFEDGPKRDRRLWLGDLRVQALTDYKTFKNYDLVKRCLYLFASCKTDSKLVSSCFFVDSPPYIDDKPDWILRDYCLFYISCLYDYYNETKDIQLVKELYPVLNEQAHLVSQVITQNVNVFIDWCPNLDKEVAFIGVYLYALRHFEFLSKLIGESTDWIQAEIKSAEKLLLSFKKEGVFVTSRGQVSPHSQVWAVLSGTLSIKEGQALLNKLDTLGNEYSMRTPFAVHYYIEALYSVGLKEKAIEKIKDYWGKMLDAGFDCCPECFNENNDFESPYNAPELNSACHAWSCTPAYWILKYVDEK